jgi:tight adherence protein C
VLSTTHLVLASAVTAAGMAAVAAGVLERRRHLAVEVLLADDDATEPSTADVWQDRLEESAASRLLRPLVERSTGAVRHLLPRTRLAEVRQQLLRAGLAGRLSAEEFVSLQLLSTGAGVGLAALVFSGTVRSLALALLVAFVGVITPKALLDNRRRARVEQVQRELPDALDLLAICVEAGQGLEAALATVATREDGVLPAELRHTLREMELGVSRRAALEHLRDRLGVPDVSGLVAALVQADVLGTPIGTVLHIQATEQRRRRRAQVREQAGKLPVKMLVPMTIFILPALFVVVLGPAAMDIAAVFG